MFSQRFVWFWYACAQPGNPRRQISYCGLVLIDTHTHAVSPDELRYPRRPFALANGAWWDLRDCSFEQLDATIGQTTVDHAVVVQAAGAYGSTNDYLIDCLRRDDQRYLGIGIINPVSDQRDPSSVDVDPIDQLAVLAAAKNVGGIRLFHIPTPAESWLDSAPGSRLIDAAVDRGLAITVCCQSHDLPALAMQLRRRPDVMFTLDHCGFPDFSGGAPFPHAQALWDLAMFDNVAVKFTPTCARMSIEHDPPAAMLEHLVATFGAHRVMWGSDWPQHRELHPAFDPTELRFRTYDEMVAEIVSWTDRLPANDRDLVLGETANRLLFQR